MDTILAAGAQGECPAQLIALLQAAGYIGPLDAGGPQLDQLDADVMMLVALAQADLGVSEPEELPVTLADGTSQVIKGALIGQATWDALRVKAAHRTGLFLVAPKAPAAPAEAAQAGEPAAKAPAEPQQAGEIATEGERAAQQAAALEAVAAASPEQQAAALEAMAGAASPEQVTAGEAAAAGGPGT